MGKHFTFERRVARYLSVLTTGVGASPENRRSRCDHPRGPASASATVQTVVVLGGTEHAPSGRCAAPCDVTVPGGDDVMLGYQSASFHDVLYARQVLGLCPVPEFEAWLTEVGVMDQRGTVLPVDLS